MAVDVNVVSTATNWLGWVAAGVTLGGIVTAWLIASRNLRQDRRERRLAETVRWATDLAQFAMFILDMGVSAILELPDTDAALVALRKLGERFQLVRMTGVYVRGVADRHFKEVLAPAISEAVHKLQGLGLRLINDLTKEGRLYTKEERESRLAGASDTDRDRFKNMTWATQEDFLAALDAQELEAAAADIIKGATSLQ